MSAIIQGLLASYKSLINYPTTGLVAYYRLESNANDSYGINNGTANSITYVTGKNNLGASFDGTTSSITGVVKPSTSNGSFTVNAWVKYNSLSDYQTIATWGSNVSNSSVFLFKEITTNKFVVNLYGGGGVATGTTVATTGTWYMVTATYDGTNLRLYVNGTLESTGANITATIGGIYSYIGLGYDGSSFKHNGVIDEVSYHNTNLDSTTIQSIYNFGSGIFY